MTFISKLHCVPCTEAKIFAFSFEREAAILGVGYSTQAVAGHYYTVVVGIIYSCLAIKPAITKVREFKAKRDTEFSPSV
jgi:hypothetical protein